MSNSLIRVFDEERGVYDKLYAPRMEVLFQPNDDGSPSMTGRVVFHTQWWHFRDGAVFAKSDGPRLEDYFHNLMGKSWPMPDGGSISSEELILGNIGAFETIATLQMTRSLIDDPLMAAEPPANQESEEEPPVDE